MFSDLNPDQLQAVKTSCQYNLIIAGPGTGKTKTLISRIHFLVTHDFIDPAKILCLTFTQKAATELSSRLEHITLSHPPFVGTFHSFCHQLLIQQGVKPSYIDNPTRFQILRQLFPKIKDVSQKISLIKNQMSENLEYQTIVSQYQAKLTKLGLTDYDDLLIQVLTLLQSDQSLKNHIQNRFLHVLVDEFQDTSFIQYQILRQILGYQNKFFAIGDPLQSIYSFRGANAFVFDQFQKDYPNTQKFTLSVNYRSTPSIIKISQKLFPNHYHLKSIASSDLPVNLIYCSSPFAESKYIIDNISQSIGGLDLNSSSHLSSAAQDQLTFSDFAILYRTRRINQLLKKMLNHSGIPYQALGDESIYLQKDIAQIIAALRYLQDPNNSTPLNLESFQVPLIQNISLVIDSQIDLQAIIKTIIEKLALKITPVILEFTNLALTFSNYPDKLSKFLDYIDKISQNNFYDPLADKVTLSTIHSAKGLEFSQVFLSGFEDGLIPYTQKESDPSEERRLLYVALTRAKTNLFLLSSQTRFGHPTTISRYYQDLKDPLLVESTFTSKTKSSRKQLQLL